MEYITKIILNEREISNCNEFSIDNFQWTCLQKPITTGKMGYIPNKGFYIQMKCNESNPKRIYRNHQEPVYKDSAVEAFFSFPLACDYDKPLPLECVYFNFEVNSNGAMLANYGFGRKNRSFVSLEQLRNFDIKANIEHDYWTVSFIVPQTLINDICNIVNFEKGNIFYCNFYKISEDPTIEHYASFSKIETEQPNFHRPDFFARCKIE